MRIVPILALTLAFAAPAEAQAVPALSIASTNDFGPYLVGPDGRPVYAFVTEDVRGGNEITPLLACRNRCLEDWPLATVPEPDFLVAEGIDPFLAEPLEWMGELILVYDTKALFYYFRDEPGAPPQGQEIHEWGGWWYLMRPDGTLIRTGIAPEPTR